MLKDGNLRNCEAVERNSATMTHLYNYTTAFKEDGVIRSAAIIKLQAFKRWSDEAIFRTVMEVYGPRLQKVNYRQAGFDYGADAETRVQAILKLMERTKR